MELTQEQLDQMLADAKKGLFSEDELNRRVTSEVDRRVESGIQKGLETQKSKWEEDFKKKQTMTAEQIADEKLKEQLQTLTVKEKEIAKKANMLEAKDMLANASIPKSHYDKFISVLVSDNEEVTKANVANFITMFTETKTDIENKVKSELSNIPKPNQGTGDKGISKADFRKMGYAEKLALKQTNPELYKELMK